MCVYMYSFGMPSGYDILNKNRKQTNNKTFSYEKNTASLTAMEWMWVSPQNLCVKILTPKMMVIRDASYDRWLGPEGRALKNGMSDLIEKTLENFLISSAMWGHSWKMSIYKP